MKVTRQYKDRKTGKTIQVDIDLDIEAICKQVAARALTSKRSTATMLKGGVKARITNTTVMQGE